MGETKGLTWGYCVNSQKRDEGVKPRARAMVTRGRHVACAQMMIGRGWPIAHAQTMAEGGWPIAHACAYAVVMAKRQKAHAGSA